jgi:cytochrome c556
MQTAFMDPSVGAPLYTKALGWVSVDSLRLRDGGHMTRERFGWVLIGLVVGIALAMLGVTNSVSEELPSGQALVDLRVQQLKQGGGAMQFLGAYDGSDAAKAQAAAKVLDDNAASMGSWFPAGSGPGGAGIEKTRAKADIWSNWADFEAKIKAFDDASGVLTNAVATNDPAAIKTALGGVGQACKACHEAYRTPED